MAVMNQEIFAAENGTMLQLEVDWDPETLPVIDSILDIVCFLHSLSNLSTSKSSSLYFNRTICP